MTTTLLDCPVSCIPCSELTNVLDVPESDITCIIVSSIALALSCFVSQSVFLCSSHHAQHRASFDISLGVESTREFAERGIVGTS